MHPASARGLAHADRPRPEHAIEKGTPQAPAAPRNVVHHANFLEGAGGLPDNSVDLAIVDPPYNASKGGAWKWDSGAALPGFGGDWKKVAETWDSMSLADYFAFTLTWLAEIKRLVKPTGSFWVHGTYHNAGIINFALQLLEVEIINEVVWFKRNSFPNLSGRRLTASHETLLWAHTGKKRLYHFDYERAKAYHDPADRLKQPGKQMRTVWDIPNNKERSELRHGRHPTQKPLRLTQRMIQLSARRGGLCLVPFAGSGTECVAARREGLDFIAFELEDEFVELARTRVLEDARLL